MQGLDSLDDHGELAEWPRKPQVSTRQHVSWALARPPIARRLAVTPAGAHAPHPYGLQLERLHRWDEAADVLREAEKLGFGSVVTGKLGSADRNNGLDVTEYAQLSDMVSRIAAQGKRPMPEPEPEAW